MVAAQVLGLQEEPYKKLLLTNLGNGPADLTPIPGFIILALAHASYQFG